MNAVEFPDSRLSATADDPFLWPEAGVQFTGRLLPILQRAVQITAITGIPCLKQDNQVTWIIGVAILRRDSQLAAKIRTAAWR